MNNLSYENKEIFKFLLQNSPVATCTIKGGKDFPQINGLVEFYEFGQSVFVIANVDNLPKTNTNIFAFHIHEGSSCENDFEETKGHLNPKNLPHPLHEGDLAPLFSNNGSAWQALYTTRFKISDILGRVIIIHEDVDDFTSQPSGNSGRKIACGKIEGYARGRK